MNNSTIETKYSRENTGYELTIQGKGIRKFASDMKSRLNEISRCVHVCLVDEVSTLENQEEKTTSTPIHKNSLLRHLQSSNGPKKMAS